MNTILSLWLKKTTRRKEEIEELMETGNRKKRPFFQLIEFSSIFKSN